MTAIRALTAARLRTPVVVVGCERGAGAFAAAVAAEGATFLPVTCAGNLHTSTVELLLRAGAAGVLIVACPPRDCWNREGPRWLHARVYDGREAELQERVDRRRVRIAYANAAERRRALASLRAFQKDVSALALPDRIGALEVDTVCEPDERPVGV
jgi:coenzyme F420-reducing hydrogenase delta subunit